ncbi:uncharacterized protein LOC135401738 isoform X1 [Ornithodoros turicata]|uniref:uncharacterized protein LOC135401738 isoform X1 n=1 Tax=Ornithodoros turicata TaxID=34597 RepID=UPI0031391FA4
MFIVDKVIRLAHKEAAKNLGNISSRRGSRRSVERLSVLSVDTDLLMARLASSVKSLHMVEEEKKKQLSKARRQRRSSSLKGGPQNATDAGKRVAPKRMHSRNTSPTRIKSNTLGTKPYKSAAQLGGKLNEPDAVERRRAEHSLDILMPPVMDKRRASVGFARLRGISIPSLGDTKETTQPGDKMADTAPVTKTSDIPGVPGRNRRPSIMKTCGLAGKRRSIQMHRRLSVLEFEAHMAAQDVKDAHQSSLDVGSQRKKKPHILSSLYGVPVTAQVGLSDKSVGDHIQLEDEYERIYLAARNAFLIAPTLMTVTGTWPSFWTQPAIGAFETYFPVLSIWRTPYMTTVVGILVLIGSLLSSTLGCIFLYAVNLHQLEPELEADLGPEVVQYASKKLEEVGPPRREELVFFCWLAAYSVCFVVRASLNVDASEGQMWILTMIMVMTSAFASLFNPDMMTRNVICGKMPWNVVVIFGGARAITRAFKVNNLVGVLFSFFDAEFWRTRSSIVSQIYLSTLSGILAEMINNATLSQLLMPVLFNIAATRDEHPLYYAIPVSLAASSNLILPISLPLIILHDTIDIPMQQLVVAGVTMKVIAVASTITFMNMMGNQFFRWSDDANPPTNLTHNDSTAYGISI